MNQIERSFEWRVMIHWGDEPEPVIETFVNRERAEHRIAFIRSIAEWSPGEIELQRRRVVRFPWTTFEEEDTDDV